MLQSETGGPRLQLWLCLFGCLLLANAYVARLVFARPEPAAALALASALLLGAPLVYGAVRDLLLNRVEMNELAGLSFLAALGTGQYDVAAFIAMFLVISQLIESRSQLGARKNLEALLKLAPHRALVQRNASFVDVDAAALDVGDIVRVRPGARVPCDGIVTEGLSTVDESTITGESLPARKSVGDPLFAGTINQTGSLTAKVTVAAGDTTFSRIRELVARAEGSRTPVMRLINRYVAWYTPLVLMTAAIVLFFTRDINRAISMLIVACPCTVLLSTPTALVAALSAAARLGVIIKDVASLETAKRVNTVIFDKTGTLTTGQLAVIGVEVVPGTGEALDSDTLLGLASSLEQHSTHPAACAVVAEARARNCLLDGASDVHERTGMGIEGRVEGRRLAVGRAAWIAELCGVPGPAADDRATTRLAVARDGQHVGTLHLADAVRPGAAEVVDRLKRDGIERVVMLTGDLRPVAERIAGGLGCEVDAEVLPHDKMARVEAAQRQGQTVAMVGDGVNDAPALATANVSIAMGAAGSDVAIDSASIVLMNNRLDRVPFVLTLSRRVVATMRQNLLLSTVYIMVLLWLSAAGLVSPVVAVLLHTSSSLFVVFNSARLLRVGEELS